MASSLEALEFRQGIRTHPEIRGAKRFSSRAFVQEEASFRDRAGRLVGPESIGRQEGYPAGLEAISTIAQPSRILASYSAR